MTILILALGIIIGIILTFSTYLFSRKNPSLFEKVGQIKTPLDAIFEDKAYIAGSESDSERYPEDKEIKIK